MRILMMGTGGFAVPTFRWLLESEHEVPALVTRPRAGRRDKRSKISDPMREIAEAAELPIYDPASINDSLAINWLRELAPELMVVCDYGQILSSDALAAAPLGGINLHASLLPKYRGAAPINWAVYHGEAQTGVTVIHMTPRLDAGPCLVQSAVDISRTETADALEERLAALGVSAIDKSIAQLANWDRASAIGEIQDQTQATKAPRLKKADGQLDWSRSAEQLYCQIKAMKPWPGTFTYLPRAGKPAMRLLVDWAEPVGGNGEGTPPATVIGSPTKELVVAAGEGALRISRVQPEGKRRVEAVDFVRGYRIETGFQFQTQP